MTMTRLDRRALVAGAGAAVLAGCVPADRIAEDQKTEPRGGIGGTGIVGTLTGFGSLLVNGLKVEVPRDLQIETVFGAMGQDRLAVGHNLTIEAKNVDGALVARRVAVVFPVVGTIEALQAGGRVLKVAGVSVQSEGGVVAELALGQTVAVSGAWNGDEVVASRITTGQDLPTIVSGTLRQSARGWTVGAVPVSLAEGMKPEDGGFATAIGRLEAGQLEVDRLIQGRFTGAAGPLNALSVEGYFTPTGTAPFHTIDGLGHSLSADSEIDPYLGRRVLLSGSYDGLFKVERALNLPESLEERQQLLRSR